MRFTLIASVVTIFVVLRQSAKVAALIANGTLFYQVRGGVCLTDSVTQLETFTSVTSASQCVVKCFANARCATYQYYKDQKTCLLFPSITYDYFAKNSAAVNAKSCVLYNRRCLGSNMYYNFTGVYLANSTSADWQAARDWCLNSRYDLLVINSLTKLTYFRSNIGNSNNYFIGATGPFYNMTWVDGSLVAGLISFAQQSCGNGGECASLSSSGPSNILCTCTSAYAMCGCDEWGLI